MTADVSTAPRLVADIGGTNTRLALHSTESGDFTELRLYRNRDYAGPGDIIASWLGEHSGPTPRNCCIAVAAPPGDDLVKMSNIDWVFSCRELAERFGFERMKRLNDFEANAYALPHLGEGDYTVLHAGDARANHKLAVMGPGTGLGGATLERLNGQPTATSCEPGHTGLSPASQEELEIFSRLLPEGEIYTERLVSGPGLILLYQLLADIRQLEQAATSPDQVSALALEQQDDLGVAAMDIFCGLLGSACGDFVLDNGAYGGLYLAGGILPRMVDFLRASSFHRRFCDKGAMRAQLQRVPIYLITEPQPGLLGAAHAPF